MLNNCKTQLGRHIAELLEKPILLKRMSDISSMYVGESEKNIKNVFQEALSKKAVLMIDEADSLFQSRVSARNSWKISQTNELLAQMEDYEGVFICTTNLLNNFDSAAMRRFDWKIEFLASTAKQRIQLFSTYFLDKKLPALESIKELDSLEGLCPGDFKAVWRKFRFKSSKDESMFIDALRIELAYKNNQLNK